MKSQGQVEERKLLGRGKVSLLVRNLQETVVRLFVGDALVKGPVGNPVQKGEVGRRILVPGCFSICFSIEESRLVSPC